MVENMVDYALAYLDKGWSVIPVTASKKKPAVPWTDYQTRLPTHEEVRAWWAQNPNYNIGIVTGRVSGLVVVDVDIDRGANPREVFAKYPTDAIAVTGSGGFHLLYQYPENTDFVPNQVGEDGIDIRADGGLIVVAPSLHHSGKRYRWATEGKLGPAPTSFLTKSVKPVLDGEGGWLSLLFAEGSPDGTRNDSCAKLAGYLAGKNIPPDVAHAILSSWNTRNRPKMDALELKTTVESVYKTHQTRLTQLVEPTELPGVEAGDPDFRLMNFEAYMSKFSDHEVKWMVKDWMPQQTITFLVSEPGAYKTWLLLDLALSVATGEPFLQSEDFPITDPGPVILIQQEDYHGQTVERLATVAGDKLNLRPPGEDNAFRLPPDIPIFVHPDRAFRFDNQKAIKGLSKCIDQIRPKLVILDPLYSAASTDDYMAKTAEQMFVFKMLRDTYGCSFLIAHHRNKGEGEGRQRIWGSQFLNAFLETGWQVNKTEEKVIQVHRHFKAGGSVEPVQINWDILTTSQPTRYNPKCSEAERGPPPEEKIMGLMLHFPFEALSGAKIMELCEITKPTFYRLIKRLTESGQVIKKGTKYMLGESDEEEGKAITTDF